MGADRVLTNVRLRDYAKLKASYTLTPFTTMLSLLASTGQSVVAVTELRSERQSQAQAGATRRLFRVQQQCIDNDAVGARQEGGSTPGL